MAKLMERLLCTRLDVPQGSILGPLLWNVYYDGINRLEMPAGITLIASTDDLTIVARADITKILQTSINIALTLDNNKLQWTSEKAETMLLTAKRTI